MSDNESDVELLSEPLSDNESDVESLSEPLSDNESDSLPEVLSESVPGFSLFESDVESLNEFEFEPDSESDDNGVHKLISVFAP
ncbi:hypothetical protein ACOZ3J_00060 [Weissella koreensis]|uniref:hypothetical protein n=1 Tax=Weissella koreensis TaxID=165096 RepID=UPI0012B45BE1|nr:hypothetical protein GKC51_00135 [Weissella koreensis]